MKTNIIKSILISLLVLITLFAITSQKTLSREQPASPDIATTVSEQPEEVEPPHGKLYFTFISSAYYMDKKWGHGMPVDGIKKLAQVAHDNGVPVTWLLNPRSAREGAELFAGYQEKYGDAIGHIVTANWTEASKWGSEAFYLSHLDYPKMGRLIAGELQQIKGSLPRAEIAVGGGGHRSQDMVRVLQALGYRALWGHCWEQTNTDDISDRGAPWGFYYVSPDTFKAPARDRERGLVAVEWTARDLNLAFRTGQPEVFSTDPNDVARAGICKGRDIDYWKRLVDQYARNTAYNTVVPLAVHQEAHEMECSDRVCAYSEEDIENTALMLDELFKYVKSIGAEIVTVNEAVEAYRAANTTTPPTYALFDDIYEKEYPEVLVYYDVNGQMFFERGRTEPLLIRNYLAPASADSVEFAAVSQPPEINCSETPPGAFSCDITAAETMPCGLAFWGDYSAISVSGPAATTDKILPGELAFTAFILQPGATKIEVLLTSQVTPRN